jgi:hypothetical protein
MRAAKHNQRAGKKGGGLTFSLRLFLNFATPNSS